MTASNQHSGRGIVALRDIADMLRKNGLLGNTGKALDKIADDLEEQLEAERARVKFCPYCAGAVVDVIEGPCPGCQRAERFEEQLEAARKERSDAVEVAARAMDRSQSLQEQLETLQAAIDAYWGGDDTALLQLRLSQVEET